MSHSNAYVARVLIDVGGGPLRYVAIVCDAEGRPQAWCGHAHKSEAAAEKCGAWAAGQHERDVAKAVGALRKARYAT